MFSMEIVLDAYRCLQRTGGRTPRDYCRSLTKVTDPPLRGSPTRVKTGVGVLFLCSFRFRWVGPCVSSLERSAPASPDEGVEVESGSDPSSTRTWAVGAGALVHGRVTSDCTDPQLVYRTLVFEDLTSFTPPDRGGPREKCGVKGRRGRK